MDTSEAIEVALDHIRVAHLQPGDKIICRFTEHVSMDMAERAGKRLQEFFGPDNEVLVLTAGAEISILRPPSD